MLHALVADFQGERRERPRWQASLGNSENPLLGMSV